MEEKTLERGLRGAFHPYVLQSVQFIGVSPVRVEANMDISSEFDWSINPLVGMWGGVGREGCADILVRQLYTGGVEHRVLMPPRLGVHVWAVL